MNIFFLQKHKYTTNWSLNKVQSEIKSIVNKKESDFSENITGVINEDNSFKLSNKWSIAVIKWIENSPAYLSGTLSVNKNVTVINTTVRPNSLFVILFYFILILFLCEVFGINTFIQGPKIYKLAFLPFFNLIIFGFIKVYANGLRKRFERLLQLDNEI